MSGDGCTADNHRGLTAGTLSKLQWNSGFVEIPACQILRSRGRCIAEHPLVGSLGDAISSPVVASGRVFSAAMVGKEKVALYGFDAATGTVLWKRELETGLLLRIAQVSSYAPATPVADDQPVYFYFTKLGMLMVDARTGEDVWDAPPPDPFFAFGWGRGASPAMYGEVLLFCHVGQIASAHDDARPCHHRKSHPVPRRALM